MIARLCIMQLFVGCIAMTAFSNPNVIAHRGNSSAAPENTLAAVRSAAELVPAPKFIEIDIHQSKDGVIVVCHDDNTRKTTGVDAMIRLKPFEWLRTLDAGFTNKFGDKFKNEQLPRLEEVLDAVKDKPIGIMIESKQLLLEDTVIEILRERDEVDKHVFASFDELSVYRAKQIEPKLKTLYLTGSFSQTALWRAKDVNADIMGIKFDGVEKEHVGVIHQHGMKLWQWTMNNPADMEYWIGAKTDGIITDYPAKALKLTDKK